MTYTNPTNTTEAIKACERMVFKLAHKWTRNHYQDRDDLIQEGHIGVLIAWDKFNGSKHQKDGFRFTTYAWLWIRHCIKQAAERNWNRLNKQAFKPIDEFLDIGYEMDERVVDKLRALDRLEGKKRSVVMQREEGYTFQEISDNLGLSGLHEARNTYNDAVKSIAA